MHQRTHKLIIVGAEHVGKSNIVSKFLKEPHLRDYSPTIGVEFHTRITQIDPHKWVKFSLWDTSGQTMFRSLIETFFDSVEGCVAVYDVTDRDSYVDVVRWVSAHPELKVILVGNKADLKDSREVKTQEGLATAERHGWQFAELDFHASSQEIFVNLSNALSADEVVENTPVVKSVENDYPCCRLM